MSEANTGRERGALLHDQGRHDLAERELRQHLSDSPGDAVAHALLSLTLVELERLPEADVESQTAVVLAPDEAFAHYARARVLGARRANRESATAAAETIRLDPDHPRGYAALAGAKFGLRDWQGALDATDAGLAIAPEHETLLTLRGLALTQLGRRAESRQSFEGALRRDPSNSYAHASRGLGLLHDGKMGEALEAFKESLRLDPTNEMARNGLVEALKSRNPVYASVLRGMLLVGRLGGRATLFLFIGFLLVQDGLRALARARPELQPIVIPILIVYAVVVWITFAANPLFNLLLRLDSVGRHALTAEQRMESSLVGPLVAVGLPAALVAIVTGATIPILIAILGLGLVVPIAATFICDQGWPRTVMALYTLVVAFVGVMALAVAGIRSEPVGLGLGVLCIALVSISTWIALPLSRVTVRR